MKYYLIAGEASGDLHASNLMRSLKAKDANADFRFFGGDLMKSVGGTLVKHYNQMAYMGFIPVIMNLNTILKNMQFCKDDIKKYSPDVVILIDYAGFNLKIAKYLKTKLQTPVVYYIAPKVWAWKEYRVKSFKKYVDKMLSILPFEVDFFQKHNYQVDYVGNPTVDAIATRPNRDETFTQFTQRNGLSNKPIIAILAGSRKQEIKDNLVAMLDASKEFTTDYQIIIAGAPGIDNNFYSQFTKNTSAMVLFGQTYEILSQAKAALVTSGTATLETALLNTPQVVCYHMPMATASQWFFDYILHTKYISLVNLICDKEVVKELFAKNFSVELIRTELKQILFSVEYRENMLINYKNMQQILGEPGASTRAAEKILSYKF